MINKKLIALIIGFLILFICAYGYAQYNGNNSINPINNTIIKKNTTKSIKHNITQSNVKNKTINGTSITNKENYVTMTSKWPTSIQKRGTSMRVNIIMENKGNNTVYEVGIGNVNIGKNFGTLKPGETIKSSYNIYIPTDEDFVQFMGSNYDLENPWECGGVELNFLDSRGVLHRGIEFNNDITIKWV